MRASPPSDAPHAEPPVAREPVGSGRRGRRAGQAARVRLRQKVLRTEYLCPLGPVEPARTRRKLTPGPAGETRLHLFHSSLPHGRRKPTDESEKFQDICVKNRANCGTNGPKTHQRACLFGQMSPLIGSIEGLARESGAARARESGPDRAREAPPARARAPDRGPAPARLPARGSSPRGAVDEGSCAE